MESSNLPSWVQDLSIFVVACLSIIVGAWRYISTQPGAAKKANNEPAVSQVVAASFIDSKLLRELIDALREHSEENARIALRITRSQSELREAVIEQTEAARLQSDATLNMLRFVSRSQNIKDVI